MPVVAHVAATVAPVCAKFMSIAPNLSLIRFNLSTVCAQFRLRRAFAAVAS
jgi:hypothetical protein